MLYALCEVVLPCTDDCSFAVEHGDDFGYWVNEIDSETGIVYNFYVGIDNEWQSLRTDQLPDG